MTDTRWHEHDGGIWRPLIPMLRVIEVWPVGNSEPYVAAACCVDWSLPLRWRFLPFEPAVPPAPTAVPDCFWPLVYADSALAYIREHHPAVYAECGDDEKFAAERKAVIAAAQKERKP